MDELQKLLENAGVPVSEDEYGRDQGAEDEMDRQEYLFANFEAELDELLGRADAEINEMVDDEGMHQEFKKSLKHQLKKVATEKLYNWTKAEIEWLKKID